MKSIDFMTAKKTDFKVKKFQKKVDICVVMVYNVYK